jgi:similar to stage IV sporulation protein
MTVTEGEPLKAIGDTVLKGDIIVSGITQTRLYQNSFRHARAKVTAEVEHFIEVTAPLEQVAYKETGQIATRRFLRVFMWDFPLFPPVGIPKPYNVERVFEPFTVLGKELSVGVYTERYHLMRAEDVSYSADEGRILALRELGARERAELGDAEILEKTVASRAKPEAVTVTARYLCRMDIAEEKPILIGTAPDP